MFSSEYCYLPADEKCCDWSDDEISQLNAHVTKKWRTWCLRAPSLVQLLTVLLFSALSIVIFMYINLRLPTVLQPHFDCGTTLSTAQVRGCIFDQLAKVWLPPACPRYGLEEYLSAGSTMANTSTGEWQYYHERDSMREMSVQEMSEMAVLSPHAENNQWWSTGWEHAVHCTWMLLRMAHAYDTGQRRDQFGSSFHHTKHCAMFMLDRALESPAVNDIRTVGNAGFGSC